MINESLYTTRLEMLDDPHFDKNYHIPPNMVNTFLIDPDFNIEYYRIKNIIKRENNRLDMLKSEQDIKNNIKNDIISNFKKNVQDAKSSIQIPPFCLFYNNDIYFDKDDTDYIDSLVEFEYNNYKTV